MAQARIFNAKKRRVLRKQIPLMESLSGALLFCGLTVILLWFLSQKDNYTPEERDISLEQLLQKTDAPTLYTPPFKSWVEPGTAPETASQNLGIFPQAILDEAWHIASPLKQFQSENLYEKINGEAEKFIKQGFQALYYLSLQSRQGSEEIAIELFDQGNRGGSMGIFADHLSEDKVLEEQGPVIYFRTSAGAIGRKGPYFFRIAGNQSTETIRAKALQLVAAFAQLEETGNAVAKEFHILNDGMDIPLKWIAFQQENVFQYDFVTNFWFGRLEADKPARLFVHQSASPEASRDLFDAILEEQSYDYEIIEENERQAVLFHQFLKNYFVIRFQGPFIYGIENLAEQNQIAPLMERFASEFEDGS